MSTWPCQECEYDNEPNASVASEEPRGEEPKSASSDDKYANITVGIVEEILAVEGKDKLKLLKINVGKAAFLQVVTTAPNLTQGARIAVAQAGAVVRMGSEETTVKKTVVGGVASEGIICDAPMLGWVGGGAGNAALLPETFAVGSRPPENRPRLMK